MHRLATKRTTKTSRRKREREFHDHVRVLVYSGCLMFWHQSKVRKRVCDFLLVRLRPWSYDFAPFRRYCRFYCAPDPTIFHPNFGGVPVGPDRSCWGQPEHKP